VTRAEALQETYEYLRQRKAAYQMLGLAAREDLAKFCRADESCAVPGDHDRTMMLLGRQEVWLRIRQHLEKSVEELAVLFDAAALKMKDEPATD
jgi:hypothetical protein